MVTEGLAHPLLLRFHNCSVSGRKDIKSPFGIYLHDDDDPVQKDYIYRQIVDIMSTGIPVQRYGLTFRDVLSMDYSSFLEMKHRINEIIREEEKAAKEHENKNKTSEGNFDINKILQQ